MSAKQQIRIKIEHENGGTERQMNPQWPETIKQMPTVRRENETKPTQKKRKRTNSTKCVARERHLHYELCSPRKCRPIYFNRILQKIETKQNDKKIPHISSSQQCESNRVRVRTSFDFTVFF